MKTDISFIILDYFKAEKVLENIRGIMQQKIDGNIEIIIGDNSVDEKNKEILEQGIDKIKKKLKQEIKNNKNFHQKQIDISLHIFEKNVGYSVGNNILAQYAKGKYLAIINPDIQWKDEDTIYKLIHHLEKNEEIGIIAPQQKEKSGNYALSIRSFPSFITQIARRTFLRKIYPFSKRVEKDEMLHINRNRTQEVDWVQSSFLIISQKLWKQLNGFDEKYFLFLADTQLCKDAWKQKKTVVYFAETTVFSDGLRCSEGGIFTFFTSRTLRIHVIDSIKYFLL